MRVSLKRLSINIIIGGFIFNIYILYRLQDDFDHRKLNENHFLVLDWTGKQHIFKERDPIKCDFSHITPAYCQAKFQAIINNSQRTDRCTRLSNLIVHWTSDRSYLNQSNLIAYHSIHLPGNNLPRLNNEQFSTVYVLESEVHSSNGEYWHEIDFPLWYNLERSYPEPITYFDIQIYLKHLFAPVRIPFTEKIKTASIVWISSNCHAYNGRHSFIEQLMSYISIDSYGNCLNNIKSNDIRNRRKPNSVVYSSYKFVIAIENSNCEDYITEKLIEAFSSTSIPIVAGRNGKPDYARFAPKHSYINVYDYKSIKELADYLNYLSNNETAYNEYLWFRRAAFKNQTQTLSEYLHLADGIFGMNSTIRQWLLTKETSKNKYCKLVEFIYTNDWNSIHQRKKFDRPKSKEVCLSHNDLLSYFSLSIK